MPTVSRAANDAGYHPIVFGMETEYAVTTGASCPEEKRAVLDRIVRDVGNRVPSMPGVDSGIFLSNGARLYVEMGGTCFLEYASPELSTPEALVCCTAAGDRLLADAAKRYGVTLFKHNVDYTTSGTWASHESYLTRSQVGRFADDLVPHLVSRIIYTGSGGWNCQSSGLEFAISPRVLRLEQAVSAESTRNRGIFHTKDEPLSGSGDLHRLHLLSGESLHGFVPLYLRIGTTALIVALIDAGFKPDGGVKLASPLEAMRSISADVKGTKRIRVQDGNGRSTAVEVQRHYLAFVEKHLDQRWMPVWAPKVVSLWRTTLDRLESEPAAVMTELDWTVRLAIYQEWVREHSNLSWTEIESWNDILTSISRFALSLREARELGGSVDNWPDPLKPLGRRLRSEGRSIESLCEFLSLRNQLREMDVRFSQLVPEGIFAKLEVAGAVHHSMEGVTEQSIQAAMVKSPPGTRARLRGDTIRKQQGKTDYHADWSRIHDDRGRVLDLSDPFARSAKWNKNRLRNTRIDWLAPALTRVYELYEQGDFENAYRILRSGMRTHADSHPLRCYQFVRYLAWVQSRRGHSQQAIAALDDFTTGNANDNRAVRDRIVVYRFQGLASLDSQALEWIRSVDARSDETRDPMGMADLLGNKGSVLARTGSLHEAADALESACAIQEIERTHQRLRARIMADRADVCRMLREPGQAAGWLDQVDRIHRGNDFAGERADFALTYRAKLEDDTGRARALLKEAARIQKRLSNYIGLTRTFLLDARLAPFKSTATRRRKAILELRERVPDLRRCPRLRKILSRWDEWANRGSGSENGDYFWLL